MSPISQFKRYVTRKDRPAASALDMALHALDAENEDNEHTLASMSAVQYIAEFRTIRISMPRRTYKTVELWNFAEANPTTTLLVLGYTLHNIRYYRLEYPEMCIFQPNQLFHSQPGKMGDLVKVATLEVNSIQHILIDEPRMSDGAFDIFIQTLVDYNSIDKKTVKIIMLGTS